MVTQLLGGAPAGPDATEPSAARLQAIPAHYLHSSANFQLYDPQAKVLFSAPPAVVTALATLVSAVEKPLTDMAGVAGNPLNFALDYQTALDLKAVWPDVKSFLESLGVKF